MGNWKYDVFYRIGSHSRILIVFLILSALTLAFLLFASEVMEGETLEFDSWLLLALRSPVDLTTPIGPVWLQLAMRDVTALGGYTIITIFTVGAAGYLLVVRKAFSAAILSASVISGVIVSTLLKDSYLRPRPDLVPLLTQVQTTSFPSGHATNAAVTYLTLGILLAGAEATRAARVYLMTAAIFLTMVVGISRVYLGAHWPSDILAGWCVGGIWAVLCSSVSNAIRQRCELNAQSACAVSAWR